MRTSANHLAYRYWSGGWSDWTDLAGDPSGDPSALYNPRFGTAEVYEIDTGYAAYRYWSGRWSGWPGLV